MIAINRNPSAKDLKWFGLLVLLFFGILGAVARWRFGAEDAPVRLWIAGAALCLVYYAIPPLRRWLFVGWMYAAYPIGWTISHLLLLIVYYVILTPVGLAMRLAGRDPLDRSPDPAAESYWVRRTPPDSPARYFRQF
jgi:hypothetical protein